MASRKGTIRSSVRWGVIRVQRHRVLHAAIRWLCRLGAGRAGRRLSQISGVEAVYLRHSSPGSPSFVAGASDLDLTVLLDERVADDPELLSQISALVERMTPLHFYLEADDLRFATKRELDAAARQAGVPFELLYRAEDWFLLAGRELRTRREPDLPTELVPWHPEFGKWWHHLLQRYLLEGPTHSGERYMRGLYRDVVKQKMQFQAALGKPMGRSPGNLSAGEFEGVFESDPETLGLLRNLRRHGFWTEDPGPLHERLIFRTLQHAAAFYRDLPILEDDVARQPIQRDPERHARAYDALAERLRAVEGLTDQLCGAVAYPLPYALPGIYQLDLLLPDDVSCDRFRQLTDTLRRTLEGRIFEVGGENFMVSVMLEGSLVHPLVYRGLQFPFLPEHIQRYGRVLLGAEPGALKVSGSRPDLLRTCATFLPYHRFNLRRRVEHSAAGLNFSQLAAMRLYLETSVVETDLERLKRGHRDACPDSPDDALWGYLTTTEPPRSDPSYAAATSALAREYDRVEDLIEEQRS